MIDGMLAISDMLRKEALNTINFLAENYNQKFLEAIKMVQKCYQKELPPNYGVARYFSQNKLGETFQIENITEEGFKKLTTEGYILAFVSWRNEISNMWLSPIYSWTSIEKIKQDPYFNYSEHSTISWMRFTKETFLAIQIFGFAVEPDFVLQHETTLHITPDAIFRKPIRFLGLDTSIVRLVLYPLFNTKNHGNGGYLKEDYEKFGTKFNGTEYDFIQDYYSIGELVKTLDRWLFWEDILKLSGVGIRTTAKLRDRLLSIGLTSRDLHMLGEPIHKKDTLPLINTAGRYLIK